MRIIKESGLTSALDHASRASSNLFLFALIRRKRYAIKNVILESVQMQMVAISAKFTKEPSNLFSTVEQNQKSVWLRRREREAEWKAKIEAKAWALDEKTAGQELFNPRSKGFPFRIATLGQTARHHWWIMEATATSPPDDIEAGRLSVRIICLWDREMSSSCG
jgi:hypothetical protein